MLWIGKDKFLVQEGGLNLSDSDSFPSNLFSDGDFYFTFNGKKLEISDYVPEGSIVHISTRLPGGKGGFGSMLRAIGAQIEKTTNREACRDLSGRRLRDINEEKRLKNWINNKAELEKEQKEKRRKKLEKMVQEPRVEFKDSKYEEARSEMTEKVADALEQGLKAAAGPSGVSAVKRPSETVKQNKKKKPKIWGMDEDDLTGSDSDEDSEDEKLASKSNTKIPNDSKQGSSSNTDAKSSDEKRSSSSPPTVPKAQSK